MATLSMSVVHALDPAEVMRRLRRHGDLIRASYQSNVTELVEKWEDNSLACGFRTMGQKVQGTLTAVPGEVQISMSLPLMAMMFRGAIQSKIREELGKLLA